MWISDSFRNVNQTSSDFLSAFNTKSGSVISFRVISHVLEAFDGEKDERCQVKSEKNFLVLSHACSGTSGHKIGKEYL